MASSPVFIVSSERSGSNLLRTLLDNHPQLTGPRAPHFLHTFSEFAFRYRPFSVVDNVTRMLSDMIRLANCEYYDWNMKSSPEEIYGRFKPQSFLGCFDAMYSEVVRQAGVRSFICKENDLFRYLFPIRDHYPGARFIYLYRDPRAYAASWMNVPFMYSTPLDAAKNWKLEQELCIEAFGNFDLESHFVSYEELTNDPESVMTGILDFADLPVEQECFEVKSRQNDGATWNPFWKNLTSKVGTGNQEKYLEQFDRATIELIETIAREPMTHLGYELKTAANWKPSLLFRMKNRYQKRRNPTKRAATTPETVRKLKERNDVIRKIKLGLSELPQQTDRANAR